MYFGFDDDHIDLRDAVAALLEARCTPDLVRRAWDAPPGALDRSVWDELVEMGVAAALVDPDAGGLGLDERALVLVLEEAGRVALPLPIVESTCVVSVIPGAAADGRLVASDLGGPFVPAAADADVLLVRDQPTRALHLIAPADAELTAIESVDRSRRLASVRWQPSTATLVTDDPAVVDRALRRGTFGTAALLVGLTRRMIDMTADYVQHRQQFGVAVGSFQAVKHALADALLQWSFARPLVHRAAWSLAVDHPDAGRDVAMAKALASDAAIGASRVALQCHGAIGYTVEHDLHLFMKRAHALASSWGSSADHRASVRRSLLAAG